MDAKKWDKKEQIFNHISNLKDFSEKHLTSARKYQIGTYKNEYA